jgi:N-carbamoylputrescine amidase
VAANFMLDLVRVAAAAVDAQPGQIQQNLEKIKIWAGRAADQRAQVVLFPELSLSGFIPNHPTGDHESWLRHALAEARGSAIALKSRPVDALCAIAAEHRILISAGILEDAGNLLHNTQLLVGPEGLLGYWRKMHVPMFEMPFYNGGGGPQVIETPLGRIGANICFDALLPESTRLLAVQNVEIVLFPFAADPSPRTPSGWAQWAGPAIRSRCQENGVFGVACNYVGHVESAGVSQDFAGGGLIASPRGELLAEWSGPSGQSGLLLADLNALDLQAARAEPEYLFRFRRPELYGPLAEPNVS